MMEQSVTKDHGDGERLRAGLYSFLGLLLSGPPDRKLLHRTARLSGDGSELGKAIDSMAKIAGITKPAAAIREFNALFIGVGRGELLPYGSYYLTGFLHEKPLAELRNDMARYGIARASNVHEPEDNIASLMEMMAGMITGRFGVPVDLAGQQAFHNRHIGPWAGHFFSDLEAARHSVLYAPVGTVGRLFMEIESEAFRMLAA